MKKKFLKLFLLTLLLFSGLLIADKVLAIDVGTDAVDQTINLGDTDPIATVGRIINIFLGFLGIIAVGLIVYAGFVWMTSEGNEEKVSKAKNTLKNAVIGLIIVLSSFGIANFILGQFTEDGTGAPSQYSKDSERVNLGLGALGACSIDSVYPNPGQEEVPKNTSIIITFKKQLDPQTVCTDDNGDGTYCNCNGSNCDKIIPENISLYQTEMGNACLMDNDCSNGNVTEIYGQLEEQDGDNILLLTPSEYLNTQGGDVWYSMYLNSNIRDIEGNNIFANCSNDYLEWQFEVINKLDLTPPQIKEGKVFPAPDNEQDNEVIISPLSSATASIEVTGTPNSYSPPSVNSMVKNPSEGDWDNASASLSENYNSDSTEFIVNIIDNGNQAQLFDEANNSLGSAELFGNSVTFDNYLTLTINSDNYGEGSSWVISVSPEVEADTLTLGQETFIFSDNWDKNNIPISTNTQTQANYILTKLSGNEDVEVNLNGNIVELTARVAGESGNDIRLTSNSQALNLTPFSGGSDKENAFLTKDKSDKPRNATIQVNFNESINPVSVKNNIEVINATSNLSNGEACTVDADCLSYNCGDNNTCIGNSLAGEFKIVNNYKTLEFVSDNECGMNGCGGKIYCLPPISNLKVNIEAASLKPCNSNSDCLNYSPYSTCDSICQDSEGNNLPLANITSLDGITDASLNSLDGNRSGTAQGPVSYYNDNVDDPNSGDSFTWSFFINDKLELEPPKIILTYPSLDQSNINLTDPVVVRFNKLMANSTLRTGTFVQESGDKEIEHRLINLRSSSGNPVGYWVASENLDVPPLDGEPDVTEIEINHSLFSDSTTHVMQIGSGVEDIYQNCFKPSSGPDCTASELNPSCCFGTPTGDTNCN